MIFLINVLHLEVLLDIVGINHHTQMLSLQGEVQIQVQIYPERTRLSTQSMHFNFTLNISTLLLK